MYRPDCGTWSRSSSSGSTGEQQNGAPNASGGNGMIFTKTGLNGNVRSDVPIPRSYRADYAINGEPLAGDREFESFSLQRRVRLSTRISLPRSRSAAFRASVRAMAGSAFGRDGHRPATWHHWRLMSLLGQIPVPRCRRWVEANPGVLPLSESDIGSADQPKPSRVRCSCQASGRRECASSWSAVRSRG